MNKSFSELATYEKKLIEEVEKIDRSRSKSPYTGNNIRTLWNRISLLKKEIKKEKPNFNFEKIRSNEKSEEPKVEEIKKEETTQKRTKRIDSIPQKFVVAYQQIKNSPNEISNKQKDISYNKSLIQSLETEKAAFLEKINKQIEEATKTLTDNMEQLNKLMEETNTYQPLYDLFKTENLRSLRKRKATLMQSKDEDVKEILEEIAENTAGKKLIEFLKASDGLAENVQYRERAENRETILVPKQFSPENIKEYIKNFKFTDFAKRAKNDPELLTDAQIAVEIALALRRNEIDTIEIDYKNNKIGSTKNKPGEEGKMWDVKSFLKQTRRAVKIAAQLQKVIKKDQKFWRDVYRERLTELFGPNAVSDFSILRRIGGTYAANRFMKGMTAKSFADSSKLHQLQAAMRHTKDSSITSVYMNKVQLI